jgi:hypothetical protein
MGSCLSSTPEVDCLGLPFQYSNARELEGNFLYTDCTCIINQPISFGRFVLSEGVRFSRLLFLPSNRSLLLENSGASILLVQEDEGKFKSTLHFMDDEQFRYVLTAYQAFFPGEEPKENFKLKQITREAFDALRKDNRNVEAANLTRI